MNFDRELLSSVLPAYEIGEELGQGGMGVVVSGQHRQLDRRVAIKQLPEAFAADPGVRRRFTAEARVLASLDHPHVVPVYDFVEREGVCLLVMELLPGGTLRSRVAPRAAAPLRTRSRCRWPASSGLSAAHRRGILHRDVKPENMLFAVSGVLKVTDFGIAKVIGGPGTVLTRVGDVVGTPAYIAPEQVRGGKLSPATDVYAAGDDAVRAARAASSPSPSRPRARTWPCCSSTPTRSQCRCATWPPACPTRWRRR